MRHCDPDDTRYSLVSSQAWLAGPQRDICHEYGHKQGGNDHTTQFENSLSALLGTAIARNSSRAQGTNLEAVLEERTLGGWTDESDERFSFEQILDRFDGVAKKIKFFSHTASTVAPLYEWAYLGVVVTSHKTTRPNYTFLFSARKDNRNRTPLTLGVVFNSRRCVRVTVKDGGQALSYYSYTARDDLQNDTPFAEVDLAE
jgi:hypothetical protein